MSASADLNALCDDAAKACLAAGIRLSHGKAGFLLAGDQRRQEALFLGGRAKDHDRLQAMSVAAATLGHRDADMTLARMVVETAQEWL